MAIWLQVKFKNSIIMKKFGVVLCGKINHNAHLIYSNFQDLCSDSSNRMSPKRLAQKFSREGKISNRRWFGNPIRPSNSKSDAKFIVRIPSDSKIRRQNWVLIKGGYRNPIKFDQFLNFLIIIDQFLIDFEHVQLKDQKERWKCQLKDRKWQNQSKMSKSIGFFNSIFD